MCFQIHIFLVVWLQTIDNFWLNTAKNRNLEKQKTQARAGKIIATALYRYPRIQCQKHNIAQDRLPSDLLFCSLFYVIYLPSIILQKMRQQLLDAYWMIFGIRYSAVAIIWPARACVFFVFKDFYSWQYSAKSCQSTKKNLDLKTNFATNQICIIDKLCLISMSH